MNKKIYIILFSIFLSASVVFAQDVSTSVNTNSSSDQNIQSAVSNNNEIKAGQTENAAPQNEVDLETAINKKLLEAKEYLKKANESYEQGYYSKGYEYAQKAKAAANEAETLKVTLSKKLSAEAKIKQAKDLIQQAEEKEADKFAPEELANAKTALLSAQDFYDKSDWDSSLEKANESIAYAETCLTKIEENKKKLEESKTPKIVESPPTSKEGYNGEYKIKTTYKVRLIPERRDCLWRIAGYKNIYKNPLKWPIIYKANKDKIKDPDLIYPGQIFQIPELDKNGNPIKIEKKDTENNPDNTNAESDNSNAGNENKKFEESDQQTPANAGESQAAPDGK